MSWTWGTSLVAEGSSRCAHVSNVETLAQCQHVVLVKSEYEKFSLVHPNISHQPLYVHLFNQSIPLRRQRQLPQSLPKSKLLSSVDDKCSRQVVFSTSAHAASSFLIVWLSLSLLHIKASTKPHKGALWFSHDGGLEITAGTKTAPRWASDWRRRGMWHSNRDSSLLIV